ncbi:hypothetical protein [Fodinicola feengrottensis]|uniref:hypothetical protein n=1 Tax=Fodinicola feengrottensis TaxID=435914 RepID=UPI0031E0999B
MHDGQVFAAAVGLSHREQLQRLADAVPQAVDVATVIGDPCHDRIAASAEYRSRYRKALGVRPHQRLVLLSSTWWQHSLFGTWPDLFRQVMADLPLDNYRVAAALHPHLWYGHGGWQVHSWLADCQRAGLILVPPQEGWRAALIAADCVIGDHGAVTTYATALDKPILLAAFPVADVAGGSPVDLLGRSAPRLDRTLPLDAQIDRAIDEFRPGQWKDVSDLITSEPGAALVRLRALFYRLMALPEPNHEPPVRILPADFPGILTRPDIAATFVSGSAAGSVVGLTRRPADVYSGLPLSAPPAGAHLCCHAEHPVRSLLGNAEVVFRRAGEVEGSTPDILADLLVHHPGCYLAALIDDDVCFVRTRENDAILKVHTPPGFPPEAAASAAYFLLLTGPLPATVAVTLGGVENTLEISS